MAAEFEQTSLVVSTSFLAKHPMGDRVSQNGSGNNESNQVMPEYYKDAQIGFLVFLPFAIIIGNVIMPTAIALSKKRRQS